MRPIFATLKLTHGDTYFMSRYRIKRAPQLYHDGSNAQVPRTLVGPDAFDVQAHGIDAYGIHAFVNSRTAPSCASSRHTRCRSARPFDNCYLSHHRNGYAGDGGAVHGRLSAAAVLLPVRGGGLGVLRRRRALELDPRHADIRRQA